MYNGCDTLDSSQLSFRAKHSVDQESRGNASKLVFNPLIQSRAGSVLVSGSRIKSGMTKEILFQQALEFENIVVELPVISEFQFFP